MGKGNVNKAAQKRERNAKKNAALNKPTSQLKSNLQAKNIICQVCLQAFMCTSSMGDLSDHAQNKHKRRLGECFPDLVVEDEKKE
jgi:delta-aminolevulinic acid dehydratase/porphobilinogen synthase